MTTGPTLRAAERQSQRKAKKPGRVRHFFASRCWGYWPYVAIMAAVGMVCSIPFAVGTYFNFILNNLALAAGLALTALFFMVTPPTVMALFLEAIRDKPEDNHDSPRREARHSLPGHRLPEPLEPGELAALKGTHKPYEQLELILGAACSLTTNSSQPSIVNLHPNKRNQVCKIRSACLRSSNEIRTTSDSSVKLYHSPL